VLPGSKSTVADLGWLRECGLAAAIVGHAAAGRAVLGVCGGFQMLCRVIDDVVESKSGVVDGLGLLDADIAFNTEKTVKAWGGHWDAPLHAYEIHHGQVVRNTEADWLGSDTPIGIRRGAVFGTHWHGLLDNDDLRRAWLTEAAAVAGRSGFVVADDVNVSESRERQLDLMADLLAAHLDVDAVMDLLANGVPARPTITTVLAGN
jgi:adenosylcobyric acid synthase